MSQNEIMRVDVLIRTFNSADTIADCLQSVIKFIPVRKIIVADHNSTDGTPEIAGRFGAEVHSEETGLGFATKLLISKADTGPRVKMAKMENFSQVRNKKINLKAQKYKKIEAPISAGIPQA